MNCPACGVDNREGARFCRGCGAQLLEVDPNTGQRLDYIAVADFLETNIREKITSEAVDVRIGIHINSMATSRSLRPRWNAPSIRSKGLRLVARDRRRVGTGL